MEAAKKHLFVKLAFVSLISCNFFQMFFALRVDRSVVIQTIIFLLGICVLSIAFKKSLVHDRQGSDPVKIKRICFCLSLLAAIFSVLFWSICFYHQRYTNIAISMARFCCVLLFCLGIYGTFKGFKSDRKWLSIYILCITLMFLLSTFLWIICDMPTTSLTETMQRHHLYALVGVLGSILGLWSTRWCFYK